jgi:tetratricopeptide (TPR) repeat protein
MRNRLSLCLGLLLIAAIAVVFRPVLDYGFVAWDDALHVTANPHLHPVTWSHILAFWQAPYAHLYIPLTYTVWAALAWLTQTLNAAPFTAALLHRVNLLLHLGSVLVVYRLGLLLLSQERTATPRVTLAAAAGAGLFGIHPLQVEAVAWVSGLKDVLSGWWALVALWQYLACVQAPQGRQRWLHYGLASGAFGLAVLAKPAAVTVPVMGWLLATMGLGQPRGQATRLLAGWLGMALVLGCWTKGQQPNALIGDIAPLWARPMIAADAVAFYLGKLVWPIRLGPDYGRTAQSVLAQATGLLTGLVPVGLGLVVWWGWQWLRGLGLAMAVFVAGLLPVLGLVPFMFQAYSTVADRYVYLALLGPALGLGWGLLQIGRRTPVWIVCAMLFGLLGFRCAQQVQVWRDTVTLFTHALQVNPHSALAHNNLGLGLAQQGQLDAAIAQYKAALQVRPALAEAHYNLGNSLLRQGQPALAITHYVEAARLKPTWAEVHNNLGNALDNEGQVAEAIAAYQTALRLRPDFAEAHNNLGGAWLKEGRLAEALEQFRIALSLQPDRAEAHYNLAVAFSRQGRVGEAMAAYRAALRLRPGWPQAALPLAWLLLQQQPAAEAAMAEAISLAEQACRVTGYRNAPSLYTLALAYQAAGHDTSASTAARHALTLAAAAGDSTMIAQITRQFPAVARQEPPHALP